MINEAVILLGGMGTRLLPYTKTIPKEMLPVFDVPNIYLLVKEAYLSNIKKIIFVVTKHNEKIIKNFFSDDNYLNDFLKDKPDKQRHLDDLNKLINELEFIYVNQNLKGTYGALYSAKDYINNENFIVMYGDDLIDSPIPLTKSLIDNYQKNKKMQVAIYEQEDKYLPKTGIIKMDSENNLIDLVNKDEQNSKCILHGRMLLNKKIFDIKSKLIKHENDEYYLPYALLEFKKEVECYKYHGDYFNLGEKTGYIKASIHYAMKNDKEKENLLNYINNNIGD